jgi:hypothetical protein
MRNAVRASWQLTKALLAPFLGPIGYCAWMAGGVHEPHVLSVHEVLIFPSL